MSERVVEFTAEGAPALIGVLHSAPRPAEVGCVFLDSGLAPRVGHYRLYVRLARELATAGFPCLRFDFSGVGDSAPRTDGRTADEAAILETRAAIEVLGCRRAVLLGVCMGARQGFRIALVEPRVAGLALINPRGHLHEGPAAGLKLRALVGHGLRLSLASSFATRARDTLLAGDADLGRIGRIGRQLRAGDLLPGWGRAARRMLRALGRGPVLQLHAEADEGLDYLRAALGPGLWWMRRRADFELVRIAGSNHTFSQLWSQRRLLAEIGAWMRRRFAGPAEAR